MPVWGPDAPDLCPPTLPRQLPASCHMRLGGCSLLVCRGSASCIRLPNSHSTIIGRARCLPEREYEPSAPSEVSLGSMCSPCSAVLSNTHCSRAAPVSVGHCTRADCILCMRGYTSSHWFTTRKGYIQRATCSRVVLLVEVEGLSTPSLISN